MTNQIVVGYDGTPTSAEAVLWAAHESVVRDVALRIISCYHIPAVGEAALGWPATQAVASILSATDECVDQMRATAIRMFPSVRVTTAVSSGPPTLALLDDLRSEDLVVVGASDHRGKLAFWLGSTPRSLVHHSPCPVVVVRGVASRGAPDRVVVGVDGSIQSNKALRWAADEATRYHVALLVVHGWWYPYAQFEDGTSAARELTEIDAACVLDRSIERARELCEGDVSGALVEANAASAVLDAVRDGDLLVLGSRGHGAIASGLIGSTVNSVLGRSVVPVVVVR